MNRLKLAWSSVLLLLSIPYFVLFVTGSIWLFQNHLIWHWLAISAVTTLAGLAIWHYLRRQKPLESAFPVLPSETWDNAGQAAAAEVEKIALRVQAQDLSLDRPEELYRILQEVLDAVARQFHPQSKNPTLQTPVTDVLRIVELVAGDCREVAAEHVPGAHILTINDLRGLWRLGRFGQDIYVLYKVLAFFVNPVAGLLRELRDAITNNLAHSSAKEAKEFFVGFCVRKAGYYAIQLYSGQFAADDPALIGYQTRRAKLDAQRAAMNRDRLAEEPLRIVVVGQVKAGKSSLINALFGQMTAAVDVVPLTRGVHPYLLERAGMQRAFVLDTAGYDTPASSTDAFRQLQAELAHCDLILLVCSATTAAREADRNLLDQLRDYHQQHPERHMPPLLVAVTHIDLLRPVNQWQPPYNLADAQNPKARQIADACAAVAEDLGIADAALVVPVCLKTGQEYNVDDGLAAAIIEAAPAAERAKFLRVLPQYRDEQYWNQLWKQTLSAGRILLTKAGPIVAERLARRYLDVRKPGQKAKS